MVSQSLLMNQEEQVTALAVRALAGARPEPYWQDQPDAPEPLPALTTATTAGLAVIGGGFTGLWTALLAKERDQETDVVLLEARTIGWAATGRNGGFCDASLTHGLENGRARFPADIATLERLGRENLNEIELTIKENNIECDWARTGEVDVATAPWQLEGLEEEAEAARSFGHDVQVLDETQTRAELDSPTFLGGIWRKSGTALVDPARLAAGLREACRRKGVRIYEHTPVTSIGNDLTTANGTVKARQIALATGVFGGRLLRRISTRVVPVYDYVLVTEPLSQTQLESIGWRHRQGFGDRGNQFHYFRLTADNRILWGGYDAVYYNGGTIRREQLHNPDTYRKLATHFFAAFPQLEDVRFGHCWGGAIDTCSRFCAFFGTARQGRLAYAAGYTGLGVGATRFGAQVMLDLLAGEPTERTELAMMKSKPVPFPPEPARSFIIQKTRASLAAADRDHGQRDLWLRVLDRLGLGFDS